MDKQISVYEPTEQVKMEVKTDGETVWLTNLLLENMFATCLQREDCRKRILGKFCLKSLSLAAAHRLWRETQRNLGCALRSGEVAGSKRARVGAGCRAPRVKF